MKIFCSNRWSLFLAVSMLIAVAAGAGCKKQTGDPFPPTSKVAGWEKTSDTRVFAAKDLWQYIDGDAEQYVHAGVVSTSTSDYKYQGHFEAVVDVYTMGDAAGARAIFEAGRSPEAKTVQLGDAGLAYGQSVVFRKGPYLVRVVAYEAEQGTQQALLALAQGVARRL